VGVGGIILRMGEMTLTATPTCRYPGEIDAGDGPPCDDGEGPDADGAVCVVVDAAPVVAEADAEAACPYSEAGPPETYTSNRECQEDCGSDAVDLDAVGMAEKEVDVEVVGDVEPVAGLVVGGGGLWVCDEIELMVLGVGGAELEGGDGCGGEGEVFDGFVGVGGVEGLDDLSDGGGLGGIVGVKTVGEGDGGELVFEDEDGAGKGDDDEIKGKEYAGPEMDLEERLAEEEATGVVDYGGESTHFC
jgi:hypothetical protein